jgi:hypothetical protein
MQCNFCKLNILTIILNICLLLSLSLNIWLLNKLHVVYYQSDNNTWVTPQELQNIKKEIQRLENLNTKGAK